MAVPLHRVRPAGRNTVRGPGDLWDQLERAVQRGRGQELLSLLREGDRAVLLRRPEFTRTGRTIDFGGKIRLNLVQLTILERRHDLLRLILADLDTAQLVETVSDAMVTVEQERVVPVRREEEKTERMFTVAGKTGASISVISCHGSRVDWTDTFQWSALHLAVRHDVECLKVLLSLVERRLEGAALAELLDWRDTRGRTVMHLAAADPASSSPAKLLLDCGASVHPLDDYLVTPLLAAARAGTVDTARQLLDHGADSQGPHMDVTGRSALDYAHTPEMVAFLLDRDYRPSIDTLTRQLRISPDNARAILSTCLRCEEREQLLVLDLGLVLGPADCGRGAEHRGDSENRFLRTLTKQVSLLQEPAVEAVLLMKWYASRRILIFDLLLYALFIAGLTAVILYSTKPVAGDEPVLRPEETALVTMVLDRYGAELARRGWQRVELENRPPVESRPPVVAANTALDPKYKDGLNNDAGLPLLLPISGFLALFCATVFLFFMFVLRELLELIAEGPRRYFSFPENIFEVFVIGLTTLCFIFIDSYNENVYFYQLLQVMTVFFGWLGLTLQLAKFPAVGMYIQLSIMVFRQLVLSLMVFMTILLAFSFSFHLALRKHNVFDNALTSFLKTITMMVGEFNFDYDFTFESVRAVGGSNGVVQGLLMLFILMVTITIANLIIAIVIENISKMFEQAEAHQLRKTVDQITTVDNVKRTLLRCCPCLKGIFSKSLADTLGRHPLLCVRARESLGPPAGLSLNTMESWFRSGAADTFHPVYTYHEVYRKEMEPTAFLLPSRIVARSLALARRRGQASGGGARTQGASTDYSPAWRAQLPGLLLED